jgi:hypothetical protein
VTGIYNQHKVYPNLYLIVSAPPASGKGLMMSARTLLKPVHVHFVNQSRNALDEHKMKTSTIKIGSGTSVQMNKPKFCIVFVPGNCSSSKLIQHLADNDPHVPTLIIEAEIDTLAAPFHKSGRSSLLRV